jgi:glycosyltransferase involved in cell wall biosynthesis
MTTPDPRPDWAQQRQPDPPNFGQAELLSEEELERWVRRRRPRAERILERGRALCDYEEGMVSLVVLSYRRLPELRRLLDGLVPFFQQVEDYRPIEKVHVENGSGSEIVDYVKGLGFFNQVIVHPVNIGMAAALDDAYRRVRGEYVLFVEDDFLIDYDRPFLRRAVEVLEEYPEIGIVRLKDQNNWWKPFRRIAPIRRTSSGTEFWTWVPSRDLRWNVWAAGSVLFRKVSYAHTGRMPTRSRLRRRTGGMLYENVFGRRYNRTWLAAKLKDVQPFVQPNDNLPADAAPGVVRR